MLRVRTTFGGVTGSPWLSTFYFTGNDTQTGANNAVLATGAFWGAVDSHMGLSVTWSTEPEVAQLTAAGVLQALYQTTAATGTGTGGGDMLPIATQGLVKWRTGVFAGGREIRGRTFIPGLLEAVCSPTGAPTSALLTTVNTAAATLIADVNSSLAVWSKKNLQADPAVTGSTWNQFAVLRSRRD